ncbi:peptidase S1 and S6, chymotrypsin/Hap [Gloeothece citriformis PCC 7424]|uniref:Peptidase S1 and S6, chymotrypsin/Hap n=1 Tax=Gloeothece citriformis (strain PCC 7424) TaxID=65393 RepID=B7KJP4_GLOC7|nr:serine protease [Gloeothece citriformis]ACK69493.1 peptidase S1 and S6, chymotrypsin/Hap [Gloeothece citriformis PCC 7424]
MKKSVFKCRSEIGALSILFLALLTPNTYSQTQFEPVANESKAVESQVSSIPRSVLDIAQQVTVRILSDKNSGSGVIIGRKGQTYLVLTNHHVIANSSHKTYQILSADGVTHQGTLLSSSSSNSLDVAFLQFTSDRSYQVAQIGNSQQLTVGEPLLAVGFPNWYSPNPSRIENTRSWGNRAFTSSWGTVGMLLNKTIEDGYQLGYTNDIKGGMSGGPIFNKEGKLVGINGLMKSPTQGSKAIRFSDGTTASTEQSEKILSLNWGIPITTISQLRQWSAFIP